MPKKSKRAFTLLEIMVTVIIVSIVSVIALPKYTKFIEQYRMEQALMALRTIHAKAQMMYVKYHQCLPPEWTSGNPGTIDQINAVLDLNLSPELEKYFQWGYHANCFDQTAPFLGDLAFASRQNREGGGLITELYVLVVYPEPLSGKNPGCAQGEGIWPCPIPERICPVGYCGE